MDELLEHHNQIVILTYEFFAIHLFLFMIFFYLLKIKIRTMRKQNNDFHTIIDNLRNLRLSNRQEQDRGAMTRRRPPE